MKVKLEANENMQCIYHGSWSQKHALLTSLRFLVHRPFRFENRDFLQHRTQRLQRKERVKAYLIERWLNIVGTRIGGTKEVTVALLKTDAKRVEIEKRFEGRGCRNLFRRA